MQNNDLADKSISKHREKVSKRTMSNTDKSNPISSSRQENKTFNENDLWDLGEEYNVSDSELPAANRSITSSKPENATKEVHKKSTDSPQAENKKRNTSTSLIEKLALLCFFAMLLCGGAAGYYWLYKQNKRGEVHYSIKLPKKGTYATLTEYSTYWKPAEGLDGVNINAVIVPAVNISLGKGSTSGILRIYFYGYENKIIGDPINAIFENGNFQNGKSTIEIYSSDGFNNMNQFTEYQMEPNLLVQVDIREAKDRNVKGSDFKVLASSKIAPISKDSAE